MARFKNKMTRVRARDLVKSSIETKVEIPIIKEPAELSQQVDIKQSKSVKSTKKERVKREKARIKQKHKSSKYLNQLNKDFGEFTSVSDKQAVKSEKKSKGEQLSVDLLKEFIMDVYTGDKIMENGNTIKVHSFQQIMNTPELLEGILSNIVHDFPEFSDASKSLLNEVSDAIELTKGKNKEELERLIREFKQNPRRLVDFNNVRYTSSRGRINYVLYTQAIFTVFHDDIIAAGVDPNDFKYTLNWMLAVEPYEFYEEEEITSISANKTSRIRTRKFKSPQDLFNLVLSKCMDFRGIKKVK